MAINMKLYKTKKITTLVTAFSLAILNLSCSAPVIKNTEINTNSIQNNNIIKISERGADLSFNINLNKFSTKANSNGVLNSSATINKYVVYLLANTSSVSYPSGGDPLADTVAGPFTISSAGLSNIRLTGVPASPTSPNKYYYIALKAQNSSNDDLIKPNNGGAIWGGTSAGQPIAVSSGAGISVSSALVVSPTAALSTTINLKDSVGAKLETGLNINYSLGSSLTNMTLSTLYSDWATTSGIAMDNSLPDANIYFTDSLNNTIYKFPYTPGTVTFTSAISKGPITKYFDKGIGSVTTLAYSSGYLYIADTNHNAIKKLNVTTGAIETIIPAGGANFNKPRGIAVDGKDLYIADTDNDVIKKTTITSGGPITNLVSSPDVYKPTGLTVYNGFLYFLSPGDPVANNRAIKKVPLTGGTTIVRFDQSQISTTTCDMSKLVSSTSVVAGRLYFGCQNAVSSILITIPADTGTPTSLASLTGTMVGLAANNMNAVISNNTTNINNHGIFMSTSFSASGHSSYIKKPSPLINNLFPMMLTPTGIDKDSAGNIYFASQGNNKVFKLDSSGNITDLLVSSVTTPTGLAIEGSNIYIADSAAVKKVAISGGTATTLASNTGLQGVTADSTSVYFSSTDNTVKKVPNTGGAPTTLVSGLNAPDGLGIFGTDLYIADKGNNAIKKVPTVGGATTTIISTGLTAPIGVKLDSSGNMYVLDSTGIKKFNSAGILIATLFNQPFNFKAFTLDESNGSIYLTDSVRNAIYALN